jgi:hypothetical protein
LGKPVKLGHHQGVAGVYRRERMVQAGPDAGGADQAVVEVDPVPGDTELVEDLPLRGEVLLVGGAAGDQGWRSRRGSYG